MWKALIVDDEEEMRELLFCIYESAGYEVREAANGAEALEAAADFRPDIIVT